MRERENNHQSEHPAPKVNPALMFGERTPPAPGALKGTVKAKDPSAPFQRWPSADEQHIRQAAEKRERKANLHRAQA